MTSMSGINKVVAQVQELLLKIGSGIGRVRARPPEEVGKGLRATADTVEAADRPRPTEVDGYVRRPQARLTEGEKRPHWVVTADDNVFAATVHNKNWDLDQSKELIGHLDDWLAATQGKKRIIIVEGRVPPVHADVGTVIDDDLLRKTFATDRGECAAIALKGKAAGIDPISGEENEGRQFAELLRNHRPEHVLGYYVLRQMPQGLAAKEKTGIDMAAYLNETIDRFAPHMPEGIDARQAFTDLMVRDYGRSDFTGEFHKDDEAWLMQETNDPLVLGTRDSPVQNVSYECNQRRDAHYAELFQQKVDEGYAVFGQFGEIHYADVKPHIPALQNGSVVQIHP